MRILFTIWMVATVLLPVAPQTETPLPWAEAAEVGVSAQKLELIGPAMQAYADEGSVSGMVTMVARRGRLVHWEAFGFRDIESRTPIKRDDIFRIYSMTKPVTSVAVMMLVEDGEISLDDPLSRHLPAFADVVVHTGDGTVAPRRPITIEDLLRHTSGLTYGSPIGRTAVDAMYDEAGVFSGDLASLAEKVAALPLVDHPGGRWNYSVSTDVLARVVEVVSGRSFDDFLDDEIFSPLGMPDTGFFVPAAKMDRFTTLYGARLDGSLRLTDAPLNGQYTSNPTLLSGGSGLVSTAADYIRFAQMLLNGGELDGVRLLRAETVEAMRSNHLDEELVPIGFGPQRINGYGFGLGFSVLVDEDATPVPDNDGVYRWLGIGSTYFWIDPEEELIGMVLTQLYPPSLPMLEPEFQTLVYGALER